MVFWAALAGITLLALLPNEAVVLPVTVWDKLNHSAAFFVLFVLMSCAWPQRPLWLPLLALTAYGVLLELAQGLVGYRSASLLDVVANTAGLMTGLTLLVMTRSSTCRLCLRASKPPGGCESPEGREPPEGQSIGEGRR